MKFFAKTLTLVCLLLLTPSFGWAQDITENCRYTWGEGENSVTFTVSNNGTQVVNIKVQTSCGDYEEDGPIPIDNESFETESVVSTGIGSIQGTFEGNGVFGGSYRVGECQGTYSAECEDGGGGDDPNNDDGDDDNDEGEDDDDASDDDADDDSEDGEDNEDEDGEDDDGDGEDSGIPQRAFVELKPEARITGIDAAIEPQVYQMQLATLALGETDFPQLNVKVIWSEGVRPDDEYQVETDPRFRPGDPKWIPNSDGDFVADVVPGADDGERLLVRVKLLPDPEDKKLVLEPADTISPYEGKRSFDQILSLRLESELQTSVSGASRGPNQGNMISNRRIVPPN